MAISRNIWIMLLIWAVLFYLAATLIPSQSEDRLLQVNRALESTRAWNMIKSEQKIWGNGKEELKTTTLNEKASFRGWAVSESTLTEEQNFKFEVYFQQDMIYVRSNGEWIKLDYSHPMAGELEGLRDPLAFWQRNLKNVSQISEIKVNKNLIRYNLQLSPFRDQIHGILFEDLQKASIDVWIKKQPYGVQKLMLHCEFKPSLNRLYEKIDYEVLFTEILQPYDKKLPQEALKAKKME